MGSNTWEEDACPPDEEELRSVPSILTSARLRRFVDDLSDLPSGVPILRSIPVLPVRLVVAGTTGQEGDRDQDPGE